MTIETAPKPTTSVGGAQRSWRDLLPSAAGPLIALILLITASSFMSDSFLTLTNIFNIGQQVAVLAILALGGTAVILIGGIDLSVGSVVGLSGAICGYVYVVLHQPIWIAALAALVVGLAAGTINGALITVWKLPPFIATLAMLSVARGLSLVVLDGKPLSGFPDGFRNLAIYYFGGIVPSAVVVVVVVFAIGIAYLQWRPSGRALYAIGGNEEVARLSGLPVNRLKISVYALAGVMAGIGGLLLTARLDSAQPTAGTGLELDVIAAVVIGGASLTGGVGTLSGTVFGVLIIGVLRNGLNLLNVSSFWQQVIIGVVIAVAILIENFRLRSKKAKQLGSKKAKPGRKSTTQGMEG